MLMARPACANLTYPEWKSRTSVACFDTYNKTSPLYTDYTVKNQAQRQWFWMTCNEPLFYWQT